MAGRTQIAWGLTIGIAVLIPSVIGLARPVTLKAEQAVSPGEVTFTKDIAPILQRSCQNCHRPDGVAPMSLVTYEDVRPWARAMKHRTSIGPKAGVMPPWYVEKNIGIQKYKDDPSLSDDEIARVATWADSGAPRGNPADMPPPRHFDDGSAWRIGKPDLVVSTKELVVKANAADWWGEIDSVPTGLTEDRYVAAVEVKEVNDIPKVGSGRDTVGGRYVVHHMIWSTRILGEVSEREELTEQLAADENVTPWPVHEVGRNADIFDPKAGRLLKAGSSIVSNSVHLHSNGRDTKAHLEVGFKLHPKGYVPTLKRSPSRSFGNGVDIDIRPMEANQQLHAYTVLQEHTKLISFEPHLHAPGARMCLEAIWGYNIQTLTCAGYDHNWVRGYDYEDDAAPLLPRGTILHIVGYMDNSPTNKNVPDPRNWQGSGNRSVANMFIDLGQGVALNDEQFQQEMAKRREHMRLTQTDVIIGCPLCNIAPRTPAPTAPTPGIPRPSGGPKR
ncbi:MAG: cytochrome c [Acidobacteria bacterium]|nr:cytochrome c [Acidobacteriota bacterium]MBI3263191.1 cytochrome c [Acidobacteriota bacterium]